MGSSSPPTDFSVVVVASDLGIDSRSLLSEADRTQDGDENWHDCASYLPNYTNNEDLSDLDALQIFRVEGSDRSGNRIFRIVGKFFPAPVVNVERLKRFVFHKIFTELPEGPFCIVYMHSTVHKEDNSPGVTILRWIYEELPHELKERLRVVYYIHPCLWSRLFFATLGRLFLSGGVYWKIKYVSRLQYLWEDIKKGEVEIPEFVQNHDDALEDRPLTDYGIEPDRLRLSEFSTMAYSSGRHDERWAYREFAS